MKKLIYMSILIIAIGLILLIAGTGMSLFESLSETEATASDSICGVGFLLFILGFAISPTKGAIDRLDLKRRE